MPTALRKTSLLLAVSLALTGSAAINTATAQTKPATTRPESNQAETDSQVWIGAATHDIDISKARANTKWGHRIDPHVDREREWIETDLLYAGTATSYALVDRPHVPKTTSNATGDVITTDGQLAIVELGTTKPNILNPPTPVLQTRPVEVNNHR